ncbi:hypothetical protein CDEF62S_02721 [Castellaniella defragrans]
MKLSLTLVALLMGVSLSATAQPAAAQPTASQPATAQLVAAQPANGTAESSQGASASAPAPKTAAEETAASKTVAAKTSDAETTVSKTSDPKAPAEKTPASKAPATETTADESMAPFAQEGNAAALAPAQAEAITKAFEARFPAFTSIACGPPPCRASTRCRWAWTCSIRTPRWTTCCRARSSMPRCQGQAGFDRRTSGDAAAGGFRHLAVEGRHQDRRQGQWRA